MNINDLKKVSYLIENGVYDLFKSYKRLTFEFSNYVFNNFDTLDSDIFSKYDERIEYLKNIIGFENLELLEKFKKSNSMRVYRCKKRIGRILKDSHKYKLFLTLTFTDEVLNSTSQSSRRKYVFRFLKSFCCDYVANIDFGSVNSREHYHAIVSSDSKINNSCWQYGAINFKRVRITDKTDLKIAKYINKLTSHTNKNLCKCYNLIYARNVEQDNYLLNIDDVYCDNAIFTKIHFD